MSEPARLIVGPVLIAIGLLGVLKAILGLRSDEPAGFRQVEPLLARLGVRMLSSDFPYWVTQMLIMSILAFAGIAMLASVLI